MVRKRKAPGRVPSTPPHSAPDQFIAQLLAALPLGLVELSADGSITLVNPPAATMLGVQSEMLLGQPAREVIALVRRLTGDHAALGAQLDQLEAALEGPGCDPTEISLLVTTQENWALQLSQVDVGGRRFLMLTRHDEHGAHRSHERDKGVSELVAATSLTMLPWLNAIEDGASALRAAPRLLDPVVHARSVEDIANGAEQIRAVLTALDDILLLRRGPESLQVAPLDLTDLLMTLLARWKTAAPNHSLELSLPGEVPGIIADAIRLEHVLNQLIEHVVNVTPAGESIRVTIRPSGDEILVSVRNSGRVIDPEMLKQLFKPLLVTNDADDGVAGGTLGLTLARAVSAAHGGRIWAQLQEPDAHLTVFLALPLVPLDVMPVGPSRSQVVSSAVSTLVPAARLPLLRESPVVLVTDGDARMARYLRANLEAQRYRVVVARDLEDTYRHIDLEEPDLLLLDSTLSGLETPEALQRLGSYASAPLILLAPHADPLNCARALDLGVADYVAKPFGVEELLARLRAALRKRESQSKAISRETTFTSGELQIDFSLHQVLVNGRAVQLSKTEFKLLRTLAQHAGMVLAHEVLLERVWGPGYGREVDFVWVYIRRLRRKIEPDPSQPRYILTVPGVGYRLARI
jgi:DNA-binding response OmpR family regulator/signal transduction histidine kinase